MKRLLNIALVLVAALSSCKNEEWAFPDYDVQSVYFSYQGPIRTLTLGEDIFDTSLDNEKKVQIMATTGGVYKNRKDITIGIAVNNSLTQGLNFPAPFSGAVRPMPESYYRLASDRIVIPSDKLIGGVEVQLTDAFFADPLSIKTTYVIPLSMTNLSGADSILASKSYTLYAIRYINQWDGNYLRRGKDVFVGKNGNTALNTTVTRHAQYVEKDEVKKISTRSLNQVEFPVSFKAADATNINRTLLLTFSDDGNCTIAAADASFTASGSGKFVKKGEKNSWGSKDRDALYLTYQVELPERNVSSTDTLVLRDRGVKAEFFTPIAN
ncbi:uncharacterized protein DUF1735 [Arcticibacter pallidicorallinus]|uniref:Uncharacterized protein DUF1735 n=1 Tax=Arcticibacter pallidicorallinus TaxID=1259464 RepID=A0A2T0UC59_9SPHI|nr:DUF5627 domain-containing protein [Arcticibacter pallidicorallinus]PRY55531.1 uncharacterized protein DUF1735 [Arcticibacter pallidicorallinus]